MDICLPLPNGFQLAHGWTFQQHSDPKCMSESTLKRLSDQRIKLLTCVLISNMWAELKNGVHERGSRTLEGYFEECLQFLTLNSHQVRFTGEDFVLLC